MWIKKKPKIPKKYLPILEELFGLYKKYFIKDLKTRNPKKLKRNLKPVIKKHEQQFMKGEQVRVEKLNYTMLINFLPLTLLDFCQTKRPLVMFYCRPLVKILICIWCHYC
jgi:hypothetical protein